VSDMTNRQKRLPYSRTSRAWRVLVAEIGVRVVRPMQGLRKCSPQRRDVSMVELIERDEASDFLISMTVR